MEVTVYEMYMPLQIVEEGGGATVGWDLEVGMMRVMVIMKINKREEEEEEKVVAMSV